MRGSVLWGGGARSWATRTRGEGGYAHLVAKYHNRNVTSMRFLYRRRRTPVLEIVTPKETDNFQPRKFLRRATCDLKCDWRKVWTIFCCSWLIESDSYVGIVIRSYCVVRGGALFIFVRKKHVTQRHARSPPAFSLAIDRSSHLCPAWQ